MSKYTSFDTTKTLRDTETLLAALTAIGFDSTRVSVYEQPTTLYGYQGDARQEKAHIVIRRTKTGVGASNDVGFLRQPDGTYRALVSEYDQSAVKALAGEERGRPFLASLTKVYGALARDRAVQTAIKTAQHLKNTGRIPFNAAVSRTVVGKRTVVQISY